MVRHYKKTFTNVRHGKQHTSYKFYSDTNLQNAIRDVRNRRMTILAAAKKYCVPKSTIGRHILNQNQSQRNAGHPTLFTSKEEQTFVDHINMVGKWGFPFDILDIRLLAKRYLDKIGRSEPILKDNVPGVDWATNFLKRHKSELSNRFASNISTKRSCLSHEIIEKFFENIKSILEGVDSSLIINYDETNLSDNPACKKYVFKRGTKYPEKIQNSSKTAISIMYAGTASGYLFPPYVVYKAEHLWDTWTVGGPKDTRYNRSKSGWFDMVCFEDWFFSIIVPYCRRKDGKKVVLGDNLSSHFSARVLDACKEFNISFVCFPPNATHVMQPLDVAFYAPLKKYWRAILTKWKKTGGRRFTTLSKDAFPSLLKELQEKLEEDDKGKNNIVAGFRKTGIHPLDVSKPKGRIPARDANNEESLASVSASVVEILEELRFPAESTPKRRRKRVTVEPGKSVQSEDIQEATSTTTRKPRKKCAIIMDSSDDDDVAITAKEGPSREKRKTPTIASDEENDDIESCHGNSITSREIDISEKNIDASLTTGTWVLVKYSKQKYYVGRIISQSTDSDDEDNDEPFYHVSFLKKIPSKATDDYQYKFVEPAICDEDTITESMIVKKLASPVRIGTDKRVFYQFSENLSLYKVF